MRKSILTIVITLLITTLCATDALWQKAQKIAENSWRLVPGQTTIRSGQDGSNPALSNMHSPIMVKLQKKDSKL